MRAVPRSALILGLLGLIPFLWGALTLVWPWAAGWGMRAAGPRFTGPYVQLFYGAVILSFMSGVLWGFATRATGNQAGVAYALSVLPALWAFLMTGSGPATSAINLIGGFVALLLLDWQFARWGLAPAWWMALRVPLTAVVVACLGLTAWLT
jgi:hypothetical protein